MRDAGWKFDEHAHLGHGHLDPADAAQYDAKSGVDPAEELALLQAWGLDRETILVDFGAGTGAIACAAAAHCARVVAVEPSSAMLAVARRRAQSSGVSNIEFSQAGFLTYEHRGERPELVHSRNALHHLPDLWKAVALARLHDLLAPAGTFILRDLVFSFEPRELTERIERWLAEAPEDPAAGWTRTELEEHVRSEFSTFAWMLETLLAHAGFEIREATHRRGIYSTYVCAARSS